MSVNNTRVTKKSGMLVLGRKVGQSILLGEAGMVVAFPDGRKVAFEEPIEVLLVNGLSNGHVGVAAPRAFPIQRSELKA